MAIRKAKHVTSQSSESVARRPRNRLLAHFDADDLASLAAQLERIPLHLRDVLFDIDRPIDHVYFVETGVVSIVRAALDGSAVETGTVGHEGMVGLPVFFGTGSTSAQAFCQVEGAAYRMATDDFERALRAYPSFSARVGRYAGAFFTQTAQGSACNRLHTMRQRCARWLLDTHDRVESDTFALTHEFLAEMLGVRRATVSEVAAQLQRDRLISYEYRRITILDRDGLEQAACDCYRIIKREFDRLVEGQTSPSLFAGRTLSIGGETATHPPERAAVR